MKRGAVSPLYLHLACEDLRNFASFDQVVLFVHSLSGLIFSLLGFYNFQNNATIATIRHNTNTKGEHILFMKPDCLSPQYVDMRLVPVVHTNLEIPPLLLSWRKTSRVFLSLWASWWSTAWTDCAHSTGVCWGFAGPWQRSLSAPLVRNDERPWGLQLKMKCVKSDGIRTLMDCLKWPITSSPPYWQAWGRDTCTLCSTRAVTCRPSMERCRGRKCCNCPGSPKNGFQWPHSLTLSTVWRGRNLWSDLNWSCLKILCVLLFPLCPAVWLVHFIATTMMTCWP